MNKNHDKYQFNCHDLFIKEFNKIVNKHKCPSLTKDFERLKVVLIQELEDNNHNFPKHVCNRISGLDKKVYLPVFIIKNFRCAKLRF
jgi:hypothetical protein